MRHRLHVVLARHRGPCLGDALAPRKVCNARMSDKEMLKNNPRLCAVESPPQSTSICNNAKFLSCSFAFSVKEYCRTRTKHFGSPDQSSRCASGGGACWTPCLKYKWNCECDSLPFLLQLRHTSSRKIVPI